MNATQEYRRNAVMTASPEKLVLMMYDAAINFSRQARAKMEAREVAECGRLIGRAFNIVSELRVSLDADAGGPEGRTIASNLDRLYGFAMDGLLRANSRRTPEGLDEAISILSTVREGWQGVVAGV
ncbi:MAG: flagellar export chaperone FliS [Planctomycetota bacterium]